MCRLMAADTRLALSDLNQNAVKIMLTHTLQELDRTTRSKIMPSLTQSGCGSEFHII